MARPLARKRSAAAALPEWIPPQLTQLVEAAPEGDDWLHEIKFDGYRMHARLDRGSVRLFTRTGLDWTHKYPAIAEAVSSLRARQTNPSRGLTLAEMVIARHCRLDPSVQEPLALRDWPIEALPHMVPALGCSCWRSCFGRRAITEGQSNCWG